MCTEKAEHMKRVQVEHDELKVKLDALKKFQKTTKHSFLPKSEKDLLDSQRHYMDSYLYILARRLRRR